MAWKVESGHVFALLGLVFLFLGHSQVILHPTRVFAVHLFNKSVVPYLYLNTSVPLHSTLNYWIVYFNTYPSVICVLMGVFIFYFYFWSFCPFRAAPVAYEGSQARGPIGATAAGLCHSHSNARSELCLRLTPQLKARPDPKPADSVD